MNSNAKHSLLTIAYPEGCQAVIDVTKAPYHCDPTGSADSTAALIHALDDVVNSWRRAFAEQKAFFTEHPYEYEGLFEARKPFGQIFHPRPPKAKILYFPAGTYLVSDTVRYTARGIQNDIGYELPQLIQFRGQCEDSVVIKLADNLERFAAGTQRAVIDIMGGIRTNAAFHNSVENLTIDIGSGNPGAVGLGFFCCNTGAVRHVTIRSSDPERRGHCGLAIRHLDSSNALLQHLTIEGMETGIFVGHEYVNTTIEHVSLRAQLRTGIHVDRHSVAIRGIASDNAVPALTITGAEAMVSLIEGDLRGGSDSFPAIDIRDGHLFARDVASAGYRCVLQHQGSIAIAESDIREYVHGGVRVLFPEEDRQSLRLRIEDTPVVPWDADQERWACVNDHGAVGDGIADDTAAIQAAMNSGASTVYFQSGVYLIDAPIDIPASVRRVNFMKCDLMAGPVLRCSRNQGGFRVSEDDDEVLIIEDLFAMEGWRGGMTLVDHACTRTLILSDIHMHFCAVYRNSVVGGRVFLENVFGMNQFRPKEPVFDFRGQQVWARGINPERNNPEIRNDGGRLWVLGFKTEFLGTAFLTCGGGHTEVLGGSLNQCPDRLSDGLSSEEPGEVPMIINENSCVAVVAAVTDWRERSHTSYPIIGERRGDSYRVMRGASLPPRGRQPLVVPLYVGRAAT